MLKLEIKRKQQFWYRLTDAEPQQNKPSETCHQWNGAQVTLHRHFHGWRHTSSHTLQRKAMKEHGLGWGWGKAGKKAELPSTLHTAFSSTINSMWWKFLEKKKFQSNRKIIETLIIIENSNTIAITTHYFFFNLDLYLELHSRESLHESTCIYTHTYRILQEY